MSDESWESESECLVCGDRFIVLVNGLCQYCADDLDLRDDCFELGNDNSED